MDSKPVTCLEQGSIVRLSNYLAAAKYGLLSRRVFVRYTGTSGHVTEGWASLRSARGTLILQPLSSLSYSNSRWGCTRPIIRQCGHAAHSRCVEIHILSLHQKNATDHPYDGRFAANLNDGEFLCPLCKQLSNVLIPKDTIEVKRSIPLAITGVFTNNNDEPLQLDRIREVLTATPKPKLSDDLIKALSQFGASLSHTMQTSSWDSRNSKKKTNRNRWDPSLRHWDYINDNDASFTAEESKIGDILSKMRQQLIAWATVGHTSSALEASCRQQTDDSHPNDPYKEYDELCNDSHPTLVELRRVITASSQLQVVLYQELEKRFSGKNFAVIIGSLLANILDGTGIHQNDYLAKRNDHMRILGPLLVSTPCHVSRDGTLHYRNEARAVAVSMWLMSTADDQIPVPFSLRKLLGNSDNASSEKEMLDKLHEPCDTLFLPFVASTYLYVPLLCWDLDIFAGAIFSTMATNFCDIPCLFETARVLIVARLTQLVVGSGSIHDFIQRRADDNVSHNNSSAIPMNTVVSSSSDLKASIEFWNTCRLTVRKDIVPERLESEEMSLLHSSMSKAILPYARSIVLLLRATVSAIHLRANGNLENLRRPATVLENDELMFNDDGFIILKELGVPSLKDLGSAGDSGWIHLIRRWLLATLAFESFHEPFQYNPKIKVELDGKLHLDDEMSPKEESSAVKFHDETFVQVHVDADDEMEESEGLVHNDETMFDEIMMDEEEMEESGLDNNPIWSDDAEDEDMEEAVFDRFDIDEVDDAQQSGSDDQDYASDDYISNGSDGNASHGFAPPLTSDAKALSSKFAGVSRSPIIPYQASFLGNGIISPGHRGRYFDYQIAAPLMRDLSHLGMIHHAGKFFTILLIYNCP